MRRLAPLVALSLALLSGCPDSHARFSDAGAGDGGSCGGTPWLVCVSTCESDAGLPPICTRGGWACPPGTRDLSTCPPGCGGRPPYPGCVCTGTRWSCDIECPAGIDPWSPDAPGNACWAEGATCRSGGGSACGAGMFCNCEGGRWSCAVAEPDPVCWCGREPSEGDPCTEEGASCGACCPTPGSPSWPLMFCEGGRWTAGACPAIECPPVPASCPADTRSVLGRPCVEGQSCGDSCCSTAIVCEGGIWRPGPEADCFACLSFDCGPGSCRDDQYCRSGCGPDDGIEHTCEPAGDCRDCSCVPVPPGASCEMIDGHPFVREALGCG